MQGLQGQHHSTSLLLYWYPVLLPYAALWVPCGFFKDSANDAAITAMQRPRYTLRGRDIMYNAQRSHPLSPQPQPQRFSFSSWGGGRVGGLWIAVGWMGVKAANRNLKIYKKKYIMNDDEYVAENFSA